jgi:hypothetical protein
MGGLDPQLSIADNYRAWGRDARGHSPAYEMLSYSVADDDLILKFLAALLLTDLPQLAARAPPEATLAVYHCAVLAYVASADRESFAATVRGLGAVWLSNEAPGVLPGVTSEEGDDGGFVVVRDGRTPLALADGHGTWLQWLA